MKKRHIILLAILLISSGAFVWSMTTESEKTKISTLEPIEEALVLSANKSEYIDQEEDKYTQKYLQKDNIIEFYKDGELINTFDVDENNPFRINERKLHPYIKEGYPTGFYSVLDEDYSLYNLPKSTKEVLLLNNVQSGFNESVNSGIIPISYIAKFKTKGLYPEGIDLDYETTVLLIDKTGEIRKKYSFPNSYFIAKSSSPNTTFIYGTSKSIENNQVEVKIINTEFGKNQIDKFQLDDIDITHAFFNNDGALLLKVRKNKKLGIAVIDLVNKSFKSEFCKSSNCEVKIEGSDFFLEDKINETITNYKSL